MSTRKMRTGLFSPSQVHLFPGIAAKVTHKGDVAATAMELNQWTDEELADYTTKIAFDRKKFSEGHQPSRRHDSILEHANFTFGLSGVSRLVVEYLENHRIASYAEMSLRRQRTITFSKYMSEEELYDAEEMKATYLEMVEDGVHPQEARRVLPMGTTTDLVLTANMRNYPNICYHLMYSDLQEAKDLGHALFEQIMKRMKIDPEHWGFMKAAPPIQWSPFAHFLDDKDPAFRMSSHKAPFFQYTLSERKREMIEYYIEGYLSNVAIAQLRRHRIGSLYIEDYGACKERSHPQIEEPYFFTVPHKMGTLYSTPMGIMKRIKWKLNGSSLDNFLSLRLDSHAQHEIRSFARQVSECSKH